MLRICWLLHKLFLRYYPICQGYCSLTNGYFETVQNEIFIFFLKFLKVFRWRRSIVEHVREPYSKRNVREAELAKIK